MWESLNTKVEEQVISLNAILADEQIIGQAYRDKQRENTEGEHDGDFIKFGALRIVVLCRGQNFQVTLWGKGGKDVG
ncbi:hypothetical protein Tsubulata_039960, partial [Turnera subulata]